MTRKKRPATKDKKMGDSIIAISEAYDDLTHQAFAIWMRLMVTEDKDMTGYKSLANLLGFSVSQTKVYFQELRRKRYIRLKRQTVKTRKLEVTLIKRAIISGPTRFVKLSNTILQSIENEPFEKPSFHKRNDEIDFLGSVALKKPSKKSKTIDKKATLSSIDPKSGKKSSSKNASKSRSCAPNKTEIKSSKNKKAESKAGKVLSSEKPKSKKRSAKKRQDEADISDTTPELLNDFFEDSNGLNSDDEEKGERNSETKFRFLEPVVKPLGFTKGEEKYTNTSKTKDKRYYDGREEREDKRYSTINKQTNGIDLSKFQDKVRKNKQRNKQTKRQSRSDWMAREEREFSWSRIESASPKFDFDLSDSEAQRFIDILERDKRDAVRRSLVNKLGQEFADVYSRYRKMIQETEGRRRSFAIHDREVKHARQAGEMCLTKGITPVQLLKHWHKNIENFAKGSMKYPPLHFLASPANVESALCCLEDVDSPKKNRDEVSSHGFCDVSKLDPRLRRGLMEAGFSLKSYNDRFLLSIQAAAQAIADGANVYYGGETRPLVDWAIENLYGGIHEN